MLYLGLIWIRLFLSLKSEGKILHSEVEDTRIIKAMRVKAKGKPGNHQDILVFTLVCKSKSQMMKPSTRKATSPTRG